MARWAHVLSRLPLFCKLNGAEPAPGEVPTFPEPPSRTSLLRPCQSQLPVCPRCALTV